MANNSSVQGSVTLRKLRTGATATITLSSTMQLFQLYTINASNQIVCVPDWSGSNSHPVVTVNAVSSQGTVTIIDVDWEINGTPATSISGITESVSSGVYSLSINTNLVSQLNRNSGTLTARITFKDESGHESTVEKSETIRVQQAVSDGYTVMINANRTWVDGSNNATLTAVCYQGTSQVTTGITFKWFDTTDTSAANIGTGATLTVNPSMVNGSQLFVCRAYDGNNQEVDAEGVNIVDNSDTYVICATAQQYKGATAMGSSQANVTSVNVASDNTKTTITYKVTNQSGVAYSGTPSSWVIKKYHADTMKLIGEVAGAGYTNDTTTESTYNKVSVSNQASASIDVLDADYVSVGNGTVAAHDTEVIATAQATL